MPSAYATSETLILIAPDGEVLYLDNGFSRATLALENTGMPEIEYDTARAYGMEGSRVRGYTFQERQLTLQLTDTGKDRAAFHTLKAKIVNMLRPNRGGPCTLRRVRRGRIRRDIKVYSAGSPSFQSEFTRNGVGYVETLSLIAHNPFFYDPDPKTAILNQPVTGGLGFPYGFPYGYAPSGFGQRAVTYNGNVEEHPIFTVTGPFSLLRLLHIQLNTSLYINRKVDVGQTLTIDLTPGAIQVVDGDDNDYIGSVGQSDLVNFVLLPISTESPTALNTIIASGTGVTVDTTVTMTYYERFLQL